MKNGKIQQSRVKRDPESDSPSNGQKPVNWKEFDIKKAVRQDVGAAVSLLSLILDNEVILALVVGEVEKIREKMIEQEGLPKKEDFHPEMESKPV